MRYALMLGLFFSSPCGGPGFNTLPQVQVPLESVTLTADGDTSASWAFTIDKPTGAQPYGSASLQLALTRVETGSDTTVQVDLVDAAGVNVADLVDLKPVARPSPGPTHNMALPNLLEGCEAESACTRGFTLSLSLIEGDGADIDGPMLSLQTETVQIVAEEVRLGSARQ